MGRLRGHAEEKWWHNDCMVGGLESVYIVVEWKHNISLDRWELFESRVLYFSDQSI